MRKPRRQILDPTISCYYHVTSRCVQGDYLLRDDDDTRKTMMQDLLRKLHDAYAVDVCSFSIMDNHFHGVLRLNPDAAERWTDRQVMERWGKIHPPRNGSRRPLPITEEWIDQQVADTKNVAKTREKICSASQFMKDLKQPIAEFVNRQNKRKGHFWDGRFNSVAILDDVGLLAVNSYVDLNPFAAGMYEIPEDARHTSLYERIHVLKAAQKPSDDGKVQWLVPIEALGEMAEDFDPKCQGMLRGVSEKDYVTFVDSVARLVRPGKDHLDEGALPILKRLNITTASYMDIFERLCDADAGRGHVIGGQDIERDVRAGRRTAPLATQNESPSDHNDPRTSMARTDPPRTGS